MEFENKTRRRQQFRKDLFSYGDVRRSIKLTNDAANKISQQKSLLSVMQKSADFAADKIVRFYCPTRTSSILDDKIGQLVDIRHITMVIVYSRK